MSEQASQQYRVPMDTGWSKFWIVLSSCCFLLYALTPHYQLVPSSSLPASSTLKLNWIWHQLEFNAANFLSHAGFYLSLIPALLILFCIRVFDERVSFPAILAIVIVQLLLFCLFIVPTSTTLNTPLMKVSLIYFLVSGSLILVGTHLQKTLLDHWYPQFLLVIGGVFLLGGLFLPLRWPLGSSNVLDLFQQQAWRMPVVLFSSFMSLILLCCLGALLTWFTSTRRAMSLLTRLVVIFLPVVFYFNANLHSNPVAASLIDTFRNTAFLVGILIIPVIIAANLEINSASDDL